MEKGSNAEIQTGRHCHNWNNLLNTNWFCSSLLQFFTGFQRPVEYKVQIPLQVFQPFTSAPVAQLVQSRDMWIPTHCTFQAGELLDRGSFHTCLHGVHTFWLLPGMTVLGLFLEWASILPSAVRCSLFSYCLSSSCPKGPQHFALVSMEEVMVIYFITGYLSYLQGNCKFLKGEMESPYLSP